MKHTFINMNFVYTQFIRVYVRNAELDANKENFSIKKKQFLTTQSAPVPVFSTT